MCNRWRGKYHQSAMKLRPVTLTLVLMTELLLAIGCASSARNANDAETEANISRGKIRTAAAWIPSTLRFAGCARPEQSFHAVDSEKLNVCLGSLKASMKVVYRLHRRADPWLELENPDSAPECLRDLLTKIPVPREVMFQTVEEGRLSCYNAALSQSRDEILGAKVPFKGQWRLIVKFPLTEVPSNREATLRLLISWAITPIWKETGDQPQVEVVAESVCRRCLGEKGYRPENPDAPIPDTWPPSDRDEFQDLVQ